MAITNVLKVLTLTAADLNDARTLLSDAVADLVTASQPPERVTVVQGVVLGTGRVDLVALAGNEAPYQNWVGVTDSIVYIQPLDESPSLVALQAEIDAMISTQDGAGRKLRDEQRMTILIGGTQRDCLLMTFTDGAPAT